MGEARMMRAALLSVIGVLLLGAAAHAQPYIYHGNDTGGIIPWSCENEAIAQQAAAALAPSIKSLICTSPLAFSSPPWMTTQGAPRLSAYLSCGPILPEPR